MPVSGYEGSIYILDTSTAPIEITDEQLEAVDTTRTAYYAPGLLRPMRWWDPDAPIEVRVSGSLVSPDAYATVCAAGLIVFKAPQSAGATVTASFSYRPSSLASKLGKAREWTLDQKTAMKDVTNWDSDLGFDEYAPITSGATVSLARWWVDPLFGDALERGPFIALELRVTDEIAYYVYGQFSGDSIKSAVNDIADESLEVQVSGGIGFIM